MVDIEIARYLAWTQEMINLDALGQEDAADKIRDILDVIWYSLSEDDVRSIQCSSN